MSGATAAPRMSATAAKQRRRAIRCEAEAER
jgi:hypothetical protein